LDPGIGFLHVDTDARASLACDLMESIRPHCDAYVWECVTRGTLRREWFFEERNGNCRLMSSFVATLSETAPTWARAVAPVARWGADMVWSTTRSSARPTRLVTRPSASRRVPPINASMSVERPPTLPTICPGCGAALKRDARRCRACQGVETTARLTQ